MEYDGTEYSPETQHRQENLNETTIELVPTTVEDISIKRVENLYESDNKKRTLKWLERIGRVCYDSMDGIIGTSYIDFLTNIIKRGHTSVLEHLPIRIGVSVSSHNPPMCELNEVLLNKLITEWYKCSSHHTSFIAQSNQNEILIQTNLRFVLDILNTNNYTQLKGWVRHELMTLMWRVVNIVLLEPLAITKANIIKEPEYSGISIMRDAWINSLTTGSPNKHKTFLIHTNRAVTHELVRHRTLSVTQQSQRYVDSSKNKFKILNVPTIYGWDKQTRWIFQNHMMRSYEIYRSLKDHGCPPQEARDVLPNDMETIIIASGKKEWWDHFLSLRTEKNKVYPPMYVVADLIKKIMK